MPPRLGKVLNEIRKMIRDDLIRIKGGKCNRCCATENLTFHHVQPEKKSFDLSGHDLLNHTPKELLNELDKCELVCSTCHTWIHQGYCEGRR